MNLQGLMKYFTFGKQTSVGTPNEALLYKIPQLNTAQITAASFNSGITSTGYAGTVPAVPFYLTDRGPGGKPYVFQENSVSAGLVMCNFTFNALPFLVANTTGNSFGALQLFTFPQGAFQIEGGSLVFTKIDWSNKALSYVQSSNTVGSGLGATGTGAFSFGTTATADATLSGTDANIIASTNFLGAFVGGIGSNIATPGTIVSGSGNQTTRFEGGTTATSSTPMTGNLNIIVTSGTTNADSDMILLTGFLRIHVRWLGDY